LRPARPVDFMPLLMVFVVAAREGKSHNEFID
jgi:hypothetical protein